MRWREIIVIDLCVIILDAVFDFNLKWSELLMMPLSKKKCLSNALRHTLVVLEMH